MRPDSYSPYNVTVSPSDVTRQLIASPRLEDGNAVSTRVHPDPASGAPSQTAEPADSGRATARVAGRRRLSFVEALAPLALNAAVPDPNARTPPDLAWAALCEKIKSLPKPDPSACPPLTADTINRNHIK